MTKYAAYDDFSIYAIGDTPEEAKANACRDAKDPYATFQTAPITDQFANKIDELGWNGNRQAFEVGKDGHLVEIF